MKDTAAQVDGTAVIAREISEAMRHTAQQIHRSASATKAKSKKELGYVRLYRFNILFDSPD